MSEKKEGVSMNKKTNYFFIKKIAIIIIFAFIYCIMFNSYALGATVNWNNVEYVQLKADKNIYANETGNEILKSSVLGTEQKTRQEIYKVVDVGSNRLKVEVNVSWSPLDLEGWIDKSSVDFYQGEEIQFSSTSGNPGSESTTMVKGTLKGMISSTLWSVEDENNSEYSKNNGILVDNIYKLDASSEEIGEGSGQDGDEILSATQEKEKEEQIISNNGYENEKDVKEIKDMTDQELFDLYERITNYEKNYGDQNSEVEKKKEEVANELGERGYDSMDLEDAAVSGADSVDIDTIYTNQPSKTGPSSAGGNLDDVMSDADQFVQSGNPTLSNTELQNFSNTVYNIALAVGVVVAVLVGAIIGIKLMASNIETKVEAKKLLIPYVVGCVVVFGGFAIWKIVVGILQGM